MLGSPRMTASDQDLITEIYANADNSPYAQTCSDWSHIFLVPTNSSVPAFRGCGEGYGIPNAAVPPIQNNLCVHARLANDRGNNLCAGRSLGSCFSSLNDGPFDHSCAHNSPDFHPTSALAEGQTQRCLGNNCSMISAAAVGTLCANLAP